MLMRSVAVEQLVAKAFYENGTWRFTSRQNENFMQDTQAMNNNKIFSNSKLF
jgi:hypothetical protein